ncbi:MAG: hypothetical protein KF914_20270 [Rhizobiaceae bacterium]|nr:hypothetical protein [Rhizobiaceae bacterium]
MNSYLDIFCDVLRVVTFQRDERRRLDDRRPGASYPSRPYRCVPDRAGGHDPYP